jgi:uncharacterized repeat protein (TIGR03803 family)
MSYWKMVCLGCALFGVTAAASSAQTFTTLASFGSVYSSFSSFVQGRDGNLYGTVIDSNGGYGSVLRVTPSGGLTVLYNFCSKANCADGSYPGPLVLGTDGNFYGTAAGGGMFGSCDNHGCGVAFKITTTGTYTVLHAFKGSDGSYPDWLIEGSDKNFYGTASGGGSGNVGTIFKMTVAGAVTMLHNFSVSDGVGPTGLVQGTDGNLYGTTYSGGKNNPDFCQPEGGCGTVFKATTRGAFTSLHSFDLTDGATPYAPVVEASDGTFYGTTHYGNAINDGYDGTIFAITSQGRFKTAYQFQGIDTFPTVGLFPASDGNLYGTIGAGLPCGGGQIFSIGLAGQYTDVYDSCVAGGYTDTVVQATSGKFYGTYTDFGGVIYSLDTNLGPFVTFVLPTGRPGQTAQILGQGLTGTTSVTFNGVTATKFSVVSDTYMTAVVPAGATTGAVVVATPAGNLTSNVSFRISK